MASPVRPPLAVGVREISPTLTRVTETFDFRDTGPVKDGLNYYVRMGFAKSNAAGIEETLANLRDRYTSG
jgi:hypothetical protein